MKVRPDKDASLTAFLLEQLDGIEDLRSRKMFGAYGVHAGTVFFALVYEGRVYFKTSPDTRTPYEAAGMGPFCIKGKVILKNYWQVPVDVVEDAGELLLWARDAIGLGAAEASTKPRSRTRKS